MKIPESTYRLQLHAGFTLQDAAAITGYLHELGADWIYLSPVLKAESGSTHGYDVTDPTAVDPERGGPDALAGLAAAAHSHGMGILADIVPNHLGVATPAQNPWWWSLLRQGQSSPYAQYFDVDWEAGSGRILLPVLGEDDAADAPLELADGPDGLELRYYEHRFPIAPGSVPSSGDSGAGAGAGADPAAVHAAQHYELVSWWRADTDLNYRRFFAVNTLAGLRVEDPEVFDASHAEVLRWVRQGMVDGLRIDHPDGLAQPGDYLDRLAAKTDGAYVLVEKILEPGESLPPDWACAGTSGYDALAVVDRLFVDPAGREGLESTFAWSAGNTASIANTDSSASTDSTFHAGSHPPSFADLIHSTKRTVADGILGSEIRRLARLVPDSAGIESGTAVDALAELVTCLPVYRSYLPFGQEYLAAAVEEASRRRPDLVPALKGLHPLLEDINGATRDLAVRFQQTSGMVMAKGVEDTAFYRYNRLVSLNEVGADPAVFSVSLEEFHEAMVQRLNNRAYAMTTLSTHDTKRSEDTRARISVLAEIPAYWDETLRQLTDAAPLPDGEFASLLWQSVVGVWPASRQRLQDYALKAVREASSSTTWTEPDEDFEQRLAAVVDSAFDNPQVTAILEHAVERIRTYGWSNSLSAKLVQLTMPGVPDVYQGTELWDYSLVDPDNRRPVDFALRQQLLESQGKAAPAIAEDGAVKQRVVSCALRVRRDNPELFEGYVALHATGPAADHVVAFDRGGAITLATRLPIGLGESGGWDSTTVVVPEGVYADPISGQRFQGGTLALATVLGTYPVALLIRQEEHRA